MELNSILVTEEWNQKTINALKNSKKVLFMCFNINNKYLFTNQFPTVFWNMSFVPEQPGTLGILTKPEHPVFNYFPSEFYANWQWSDLLNNSKAIILDQAKTDFLPLVQIIDNPLRNHRLGAIFETAVGKGKLMVVSIDLKHNLQQRPAARQLKYSIIQYMQSPEFQPEANINLTTLNRIFSKKSEKEAKKTIAQPVIVKENGQRENSL